MNQFRPSLNEPAVDVAMCQNPKQQRGLCHQSPLVQETFEKVERAKQEWEAALDALPELICLVAPDGHVLRANLTLEHWGLGQVKTVKGHHLHALLHPTCANKPCALSAFLAQAQAKASIGQPAEFDSYDALLKRHIVIRVRPVQAHGKITSDTLSVIIEDVTKQRQQEIALHESRERYHKLITNTSFGVAIFDALGKFTVTNPAFRTLFQLSSACDVHELNAFSSPAFIDSGLAEDIRNCLRREERTTAERSLVRSGVTLYLHVNLIPLHNGKGDVVGVQMLAGDITELKLLERQRSQTQKLEAIGALAAGIAHEINTPIQFIGDNTQFLSDAFQDLMYLLNVYRQPGANHEAVVSAETEIDLSYLAREIPQSIVQTLEGVARVATIVKAMRTFAHPVTGVKVSTDINQAIQHAFTVANNEYKYVADVEIDLDTNLPLVPCDIGEINQVFLNLIINAAHAIKTKLKKMPSSDRGLITVRTRQIGDEIVVHIADTGVGIAPEISNQIFDPFFTTKPVGEGTGQGLAIVHAIIVQRHSGRITFDSEVGKGTVFSIYLPLYQS